MPIWLQASLWGLLAGSALVMGALAGYFLRLPQRLIADIMAFGSGVLIAAVTFELMDQAFHCGGIYASSFGFLGGALLFTLANALLSRYGARHRKRSGSQQPSEKADIGSGQAIAIGSLIDGIPESIAIGLSMLGGGKVSLLTVGVIFLSNIPEGMSSAAGMKKAERSAKYVFGVWFGIALICGVAALAGYSIFRHFSNEVIAATTAVAAGAILAMLADTMVPEAFETEHDFSGLITSVGFLVAFVLGRLTDDVVTCF